MSHGDDKFWADHKARYTMVTKGSKGLGEKRGFLIHEDSIVGAINTGLEERTKLSRSFTFRNTPRSFLDQPDFDSNDGRLSVECICPPGGGVGWARYPGCDHHQVSKDGKVVFRTKHYGFILKYLALWVSRNPQKERDLKPAHVAPVHKRSMRKIYPHEHASA